MFSKIYYINLNRREDRNLNILNQLNNIRYRGNVERVMAIDAKMLDFNNISSNLITKTGLETALSTDKPLYTHLTKGGIGCALSHKLVFSKILNGEDEYALILEDDIWFDEDFNEKLANILKNTPHFDILWLGYHNKTNMRQYNDLLDVPDRLYGLFGYIINKRAAKKLLEIFPITMQIDSEIPNQFKDLAVYAVKESQRIVLSEPSQIAYKFGTDIQRRDDFTNTSCNNDSTNILIILLLVIGYLLYRLYKKSI